MTNNELDIYPTVEGMDLIVPCDTCLYKKNCVYIARHKAVPKIVGCTCWESDDVEPVRHGHWILQEDNKHSCCSSCNFKRNISTQYGWDYCPHCGAKMDGKE